MDACRFISVTDTGQQITSRATAAAAGRQLVQMFHAWDVSRLECPKGITSDILRPAQANVCTLTLAFWNSRARDACTEKRSCRCDSYQYLTSIGLPRELARPAESHRFSILGNYSSLYDFWSLALKLFTDVAEMMYLSKMFQMFMIRSVKKCCLRSVRQWKPKLTSCGLAR